MVLCHGCFDIVHPGHIKHLQHAARLGDRLIVSLTSDRHIGKGANRPLIPQELRAENLAALDCIDWVVIDPHSTAAPLLKQLQPDVYVKGREYEMSRDPRFLEERAIVESCGGRVVFSSGDVIFSSTALISELEHSADPFQLSLKHIMEQHDLSAPSLERIVNQFRGVRIAVIGETIIDTYVMCDRPEVAGESPIMTLRPVEERSYDGGAAIIARHLAAMGARPILITALPRSTPAAALVSRLECEGGEVRWIETEQPLIEKRRFLVGDTKVMKLDLGDPLTLPVVEQDRLHHLADAAADETEAVIIADYGQGLFSPALISGLCHTLRGRTGVLVGDVSGRRSNLLALRDLDLLCPSEHEVRDALHDYEEGLSAVTWRLLDRTNTRAAIITQGGDGMTAFDRKSDADQRPQDWRQRLSADHIPAFARHAVDPLGCGDALLAAATLALAVRAPLVVAALLGNLAAADQARRLGNAVIAAADLRRGIYRLDEAQLTCSHAPDISFHTPHTSTLPEHTRRDQLSASHSQPT